MKHILGALAARLKHSKTFSLTAKLGLTLAAFWFALRGVDFAQLQDILRDQRPAGLLEAAALIGVQITLGALRWRIVLAALSDAGRHIFSVWKAFKLYYISVFFNGCLPGTVGGDVVRVWLAKSEQLSLQISINSVIIDRLIALAALILLVMCVLPWFGANLGSEITYLPPLMIVLAVVGIVCLLRAERLLTRYQHILPARWLLHFVHSLRMLFNYPLTSFISLLYAMLSHISFCLAAYVLARSLGIDIGILQCITLIPLVLLITTIPISIGGWGVREMSMVGLLGLVGVPPEAALMLSVELGILNIFVTLPAALLWLGYRRQIARNTGESAS